MLCAPLDWQYAALPSSASDAVLCTVLVCKMCDINQIKLKKLARSFFKLNDWMIERSLLAKSDIETAVSSKYMRPPSYSYRPSWGWK